MVGFDIGGYSTAERNPAQAIKIKKSYLTQKKAI